MRSPGQVAQGVKRFGEKVPSVFLGRDLHLVGAPACLDRGQARKASPQCGTSQELDAKWLLIRNIRGCQRRAPGGHEGVALGLESVGGSGVLGTPSDSCLQEQPGLPASEVCSDPREPVRAGSAQRPLPQRAGAGAPL